MRAADYVNVFIFITILMIVSPILGRYIAKVFDYESKGKWESFIYRLLFIDTNPQTAMSYLKNLLLFNLVGFIAFFGIVYLFPASPSPMSWHLAMNTAISFVTNTNWQAYSGEVSLTPLMQMLACTVQNFLSAATGITVLIAMIRGFRNKESNLIGNFWQDLTRSVFYILLPLSFIVAILLASSGVVQTFESQISVQTIEGTEQTLPLGPVASQVAIKQLGTNGGGYFGVNSAHPYENPTPFSNWIQLISILLIPCALVFTYGAMMKKMKHAWVIFTVMGVVWLIGTGVSLYSEYQSNPIANRMDFSEGKETRFSKTESILWATATTAASNGSVNSMHSSLSPLSGGVALFNIMLGEIIFGGVGSGMYGMIIFILLTIFLSGLMVGRTPEYLNKKITADDIKFVLVALIAPSCTILLGVALSVVTDAGLSSRLATGSHGFSEILYAWSSAAGNNGSAFAGLNANTVFYNLLLGAAMLIGRFGVIIPCFYIAQSFSTKKLIHGNAGQMSTESLIFGILLFSIIIIVGALTFFPALLLGPIVEHLSMF
jgi:K+-transporting ATPase ATPase A chain